MSDEKVVEVRADASGWWSVWVRGNYIDAYETYDEADRVARRCE